MPQGKYKNPEIFSACNILNISKILKKATISNLDFFDIKYSKQNSFIYFDPPYRALSQTSSFKSYDKEGFCDDKQRKLCDLYKNLPNNYLMLSNSDPKNTNEDDNFLIIYMINIR